MNYSNTKNIIAKIISYIMHRQMLNKYGKNLFNNLKQNVSTNIFPYTTNYDVQLT